MPAGHFCLFRCTPKQVRPPRFATSQTELVSPSHTSNKFFSPSKAPVSFAPSEALAADTCSQRLQQIFVSRRSSLPLMAPSPWATSANPIKTDHATTKVSVFFSPFGMLPVSTCASTSMPTHLNQSRRQLLALDRGQRQIHTTIINCAAAPLIESSH
jgi:hypothetical protein